MSYNNNSQERVKPILKKPPGYKDPNTPPLPPPPPSKPAGYPKKPPLPPSLRNNTTTKNNTDINRRRRQPIKRRRNWRRTCCCCFCISLLVLLTILAVASGVFYLWYRPKLPVIFLRAVHFDRFNASTGKSDDDVAGIVHLDSHATVWLEVKNPNGKLTVYFGRTAAALAVEQETDLGYGTRPEFTEGAGNVTALKFVVRVDKVEIEAGTAERLKARVKSRAVKVRVTVKTKIGFGAGKRVKVGMLPVGVDCGGGNGFTLKQLSDGRPPKCKINLFRWMKLNG